MSGEVFSINSTQYDEMTDEKLIENIEQNDTKALECLIKRYDDVVNMKANKFFMIGAERDDMVQEGMIGLYKAVKSYNSQKQNSFRTFANLCIERQLITAVKNSNRQKHMPLNGYLSLNTAAYEDDEDTTVLEVFDSHQTEDPLDTITKREYYKRVEDAIDKNLSDFEKQVLARFVKGESYVNDTKFTHFTEHFHEISGKTWGIIGLGNIGRRVADLAKAFGAKVIYYSTTGFNHQPNYDRVDLDIIWNTLQEDIPDLYKQLEDMI